MDTGESPPHISVCLGPVIPWLSVWAQLSPGAGQGLEGTFLVPDFGCESHASGKTTLLQALSFFRSVMIDKPESTIDSMGYFPFLLDKHSEGEHSHMQMTFWVKGEKYILHLEFDSKRIYEESLLVYTSARPASLYKRVYQPESDHTEVTFGNNAGIKKADQRAITGNTTNNCTVMAAFGQSNARASKLNDVFEFSILAYMPF